MEMKEGSQKTAIKKKESRIKAIIKLKKFWIPALILIIAAAGCIWYVNDYYHSDESVRAFLDGDSQVNVSEVEEGLYLNGPGEENAVVFYPGAKVEYTAYLPLLYSLAEQGTDCFLVKMPCNLAFLGADKAENIMEEYTYEHWYLAGHSLGGAMAASCVSDNIEDFDGLILLAAYPTKDLKNDALSVLSVYGSEDKVLNMEKVESGRAYMPSDYTELQIEGGNHAGFGNYGKQKGDGAAGISAENQQEQTVSAISHMIEEKQKKN